jgi:hypothetical protein
VPSQPAAADLEFYLAGEESLDELSGLDVDRDWLELLSGERAWVLQTFLRFREAGRDAVLTAHPHAPWVVFHAKHWRSLERERPDDGSFLVGVRGDVRSPPNADFEIVQNRHAADGSRRFFLPHWPQPGLVERGAERGDRVRRAAFKGHSESLHAGLRDPSWAAALSRLGVEWEADETHSRARQAERLRWPDYREVDVLVALRPPDRRLHPHKPATKLYNAWLAGVPAVLGPELAYRAERQSELDYLEAADPEQALAAVARLAAEPGLYRAMVSHGRQRAAAVTPPRILARWEDLLFRELPERAADPRARAWRRLPRRWRLLLGRARRITTRR